jgi:signal peptidase II
MTIAKRTCLIIVVLGFCVGCDQGTKAVAQTMLSETEVWSFLGDTVRLQLAYNHGAFLSLGSALPETLRAGIFSCGVGILLLVFLAYALLAKTVSKRELLALGLLLAGGVGNLIDRVAYGYVIDFLNVGMGTLRTGIFNVADVAVTTGVLLLLSDTPLIPRKPSS